jgi:GNAT superfamily N-acetyltransferase
MSTTFSFLIRDGLESDIEACLHLDHSYTTEYVWQMNLQDMGGQWQIVFKTEHLPRVMEVTHPIDERRLRLSLPDEQCFLVAVTRDSANEQEEILGYLTMHSNDSHRIAQLQDVVVAKPYRRHGIGSRLLSIARAWAREHKLVQISAEIPTKNYPAITFFQGTGSTFCGFNDRYFLNGDIAVFFSQALR